ncbi:hypothetical protein ACJIZ3_021325 [Penstemon smallii]|uniref:Uncharacterized protein n=1 Tax=Penstemon smallii TaxID=265156 RepID=A0ABD3SLQ4_9LAMI
MCNNLVVVIPIKYFPNMDTRIPFAKLHQKSHYHYLPHFSFFHLKNLKTLEQKNKGARKEIDEDSLMGNSLILDFYFHNTLKTY